MLLIPPLELFIAGIAAGLDRLQRAAVDPDRPQLADRSCRCRMLNLLVPDHNLPSAGDHDFIPLRIARELIGYPYFNLGVAIVMTVALFLMSRLRRRLGRSSEPVECVA